MVYLCSKSKMYKTKCFKTLIVILLFWKITLCNSNPTKSNLLKHRKIIFEGKIVSIRSLIQQDEIHSSTDISRHPNVFYASRECTYADAIIDLLQTFFEIFIYGVNSHTENDIPDIKNYTKNWLISAIYYFNNMKTPIAKMIDSLFYRLEKIKILKTSDQNLLKSLLSINLFLYYSEKESPFIVYTEITTKDQDVFVYTIDDNEFYKTIKNIRVLNSSIITMIGLVERFRSKRCVVRDPYTSNFITNNKLKDILIQDVDNVRSLLQPFLDRLNLLVNNGSDNYDNFDSTIYDPEYLLFEKLLGNITSFFGNFQINLNGSVSDIISMYNVAKVSYDIEHILQFQHILIKIIADIFYFQIHHLSRGEHDCINKLYKLYLSFDEYTTNMLPSNCSINVCNKILKAKVYLRKMLSSYNHSILSKLENHFKPVNNIELIIHSSFQNFADSSLSFLFENMWGEKQYESFKTVINLLSHEAYSNSDFYIIKVFDHVDIASENYDTNFLKSMVNLQYALFAFWILLKVDNNFQVSDDIITYSTDDVSDLSAIGFTTPGNDIVKKKKYVSKTKFRDNVVYGPIYDDILRVIVNLFSSLDNYPVVRNILLPLLVHIKQTDKYSHRIPEDDLPMMFQTTFLTITFVENYLIKNYSLAFYSLFIYSKLILDDNNGPDTTKLQHDLQFYAESAKISFKNTLDFLNSLYDVNSYNILFPEDDQQLKFYWKGSELFGYNIFQNVIKEVTDFKDFISLQWFCAKWVMSKILVKLHNIMLFRRSYIVSQQMFNVIKNKLLELLNLEFPMSIKTFLDDFLYALLTTLNASMSDINVNIFHRWDVLFIISLKALDAYPSNIEPLVPNIGKILNDITSEIQFLENLVGLNFLGIQNILVSTDLSLSPIKIEVHDEIIDLQYQID